MALLHWVAGVSYFKLAAPPRVRFEGDPPGPATAALLEALYSEGLGEFAYTNRLARLPRPRFAAEHGAGMGSSRESSAERRSIEPERVLVPVGGGKDSAVAIEIVRRSGLPSALFSIGDAPPIARTVAAAGLPWLMATAGARPGAGAAQRVRRPQRPRPRDRDRDRRRAPVRVAERLRHRRDGQRALGLGAGTCPGTGSRSTTSSARACGWSGCSTARSEELDAPVRAFSVLRPASELAIARAFARLDRYHEAFTSCNTIFRLDPELRGTSWCCECPKCRFVFLALAPFTTPEHLRGIFGRDLLDEEHQFDGFALLCASGGHKPFECVGEEQESLAAIRLLAGQERWRGHRVVRRLVEEVLPGHGSREGDPERVLELSDDHEVPDALMADVRAVLGA